MALWRSTTYNEFISKGSPDRCFSTDNNKVTRELQVSGAAASWLQAKADFLGSATVYDVSGRRYISRTTPHPFPLDPWLYAVSIPAIDGISYRNAPTGVAEYKIDRLTLVYSGLTYNIKEDDEVLGQYDLADEGAALARGWNFSRYVTKTVKPAAKLIILNRGVMQLVEEDVGGPRPLIEGLPYTEGCAEVQYVWHGVPADGVPVLLHSVALSTLNNATFDGYPPETLRLDSIEPIPHRDPLGNRTYDVVYRMQFLPRVGHRKGETAANDRAHGHNVVRTTVAGGHFVIARVTGSGKAIGDRPFRSINYADLFCPDNPQP